MAVNQTELEERVAQLRADIVGSLDRNSDPELLQAIEELQNPEFLAALADECAAGRRIADHFGWSLERALCWIDADDCAAMEMFAVGNSVPRETLH